MISSKWIAAGVVFAAALVVTPALFVESWGNVGPTDAVSVAQRHAPAKISVEHRRVADLCTKHGYACILNGTACCDTTDECKGTFPNTTCQAK